MSSRPAAAEAWRFRKSVAFTTDTVARRDKLHFTQFAPDTGDMLLYAESPQFRPNARPIVA